MGKYKGLLIGCGKNLRLWGNFWPYYDETCIDCVELLTLDYAEI